MGKISGCVEAKCKECGCRHQWHLDSFPFIDSQIVGTCDKCFRKQSHDCYDEYEIEDGSFKNVGRKVFTRKKIPEKKLKEDLKFHEREIERHEEKNQKHMGKHNRESGRQKRKKLRHIFISQYIKKLLE